MGGEGSPPKPILRNADSPPRPKDRPRFSVSWSKDVTGPDGVIPEHVSETNPDEIEGYTDDEQLSRIDFLKTCRVGTQDPLGLRYVGYDGMQWVSEEDFLKLCERDMKPESFSDGDPVRWVRREAPLTQEEFLKLFKHPPHTELEWVRREVPLTQDDFLKLFEQNAEQQWVRNEVPETVSTPSKKTKPKRKKKKPKAVSRSKGGTGVKPKTIPRQSKAKRSPRNSRATPKTQLGAKQSPRESMKPKSPKRKRSGSSKPKVAKMTKKASKKKATPKNSRPKATKSTETPAGEAEHDLSLTDIENLFAEGFEDEGCESQEKPPVTFV